MKVISYSNRGLVDKCHASYLHKQCPPEKKKDFEIEEIKKKESKIRQRKIRKTALFSCLDKCLISSNTFTAFVGHTQKPTYPHFTSRHTTLALNWSPIRHFFECLETLTTPLPGP